MGTDWLVSGKVSSILVLPPWTQGQIPQVRGQSHGTPPTSDTIQKPALSDWLALTWRFRDLLSELG